MPVDYDLVILGGSSAGVGAAVTAARSFHARVALVEPDVNLEPGSRECGLLALRQMSRSIRSIARVRQLTGMGSAEAESISPLNFDRPTRWASAVLANVAEVESPAVLAGFGIDVIRAEGEFCAEPRLSVMANGRVLRSRRYLIAPGSRWVTTRIEGLTRTGYLTPETLGYWVKKGQTLPQNFVILGTDPQGIELAQILARLGRSVTLITQQSQLLPYEDPEMSRWIQAQLEADGVRILTGTPITQVRKIQDKKWVQAGNRAIETDEILLAIALYPHLKPLQLEAVGIRKKRGKLVINDKLQTTNPRIYACGAALGGYALDNIDRYEAQIALKNALLLPMFSTNYHQVPWAIGGIDPTLARVGYTEPQARSRYGDDLVILKQSFQPLYQSQTSGETTGFCKAIARKNGEILGVHIWGASAEELIHAFAIVIQQNLTFEAIADLLPVSPSFSELYRELGIAWRNHRRQRKGLWQMGLKTWHNWQRDQTD
ncbi:MAG TPA: NAD(P)/FAD-dependent oxidoreductase [Oscillatoriales cyanobacterium M59_W2019_021]|nr:MAG: NAD(P)/FAD-dependent oxidoreductase [Cyanobacteria bacterium J055]HIK31099.1 NAD(P)/FAD-dependent oxidoreductase [Oscillatoriales cyanobacterium M4454_W2019_049]HIK49709.1 NAD(P)/FAD-dependent oxidoreductase [Oscillatoriales cyanobacterium M59_W2019_021]